MRHFKIDSRSTGEWYVPGMIDLPEDAPTERATRKKVRRLFDLMELLQAKDRSTQELAQMFRVPQRTIQRDLDDLRDMAVGLEALPGYRYRLRGGISHLKPIQTLGKGTDF